MVKVTQLAGAKSISLFPSLSASVPLPLPQPLFSPAPPAFQKGTVGLGKCPGWHP